MTYIQQFEFGFDTLCIDKVFQLFVRHSDSEMNVENIVFIYLIDHLSSSKKMDLLVGTTPILDFFKKKNISNLIADEFNHVGLEHEIIVEKHCSRRHSGDCFNLFDLDWLTSDDGSVIDAVKKVFIFQAIISTFVKNGKDNTINISFISRSNILNNFPSVLQDLRDLLLLYKLNSSPPDVYPLLQYITSIFSYAMAEVRQTIRSDLFSRFKRSSLFSKFLESLDFDQIRKLGSPIGTSRLIEYHLSIEDMSRNYIEERDITLAKLLVQDLYHWKVIYADPKKMMNIYTTLVPILSVEAAKLYGNLTSYKCCYKFDCSAEAFMLMFTNPSNYVKLSELAGVELVDFISGGQSKNITSKDILNSNYIHTLTPSLLQNLSRNLQVPSSSIMLTTIDKIVFKREFLQTCSICVRDGTYYFVFKSCQHKNVPFNKHLRGVCFGVVAVSPITEFTCEYTTVFFVNLRGWLSGLNNEMWLSRKALVSHICNSIEHLKKILKQNATNHKDELLLLSSFIDSTTRNFEK